MKKIILDLCGGTGSWSLPYKENGYNVRVITLPKYDIRNYKVPRLGTIYGVLAAPPCTMFSLARTTAKTPRNFKEAMQIVKACLEIIWHVQPHFWVMENPKGLLRKFLGKPAFSFDASEYGETYNKATDLWGYFNPPPKLEIYSRYPSTDKNTRKLPPLPKGYIPIESRQSARRAITPQSFARAFYNVNK